jgi:hypothetical protein
LRPLKRGDSTDATAQLEARIAATLVNMTKEVQSLFTLAHAQVALTNSLLQYVLTCVVEPPEDVLPAARARGKARYAKILRLANVNPTYQTQQTSGISSFCLNLAVTPVPPAGMQSRRNMVE